ncbi:N(5)-(carboxyethyl)ornithine synthase [Clostridium bowmanii]|uniref:N(5)-(carboxyethyl)ornithine synthase n=1 Tax=Clostridium bowmanii TaxID=132925 RepID=UPI001C0B8B22|nr:N(5)-(carboxyethyl)ornithine synthase [Clostridium bowmanii]MBU3191370.1 N(5)-(carboxyethyl)ornithine synthase [Clostridium bowmanii]MCA1075785.1 N(5)-(carboxyethyl)ornithine synthase [Clostridium bowmanii]
MKLGFIIPNYPDEKRVALLPAHVNDFENDIVIEHNFGLNLNIKDYEYEKVGCKIATRAEIFSDCPAIFSIKCIQEVDYKNIRPNQMIIGWTHPNGSGKGFMESQFNLKNLTIVDLDNIHPQVYYKDKIKLIDWIKPNFIKDNSFIAGYSSVLHALLSFGMIPDHSTNIAVLGCGNVSQGAFCAVSKFNNNVRMFYRKTMDEFIEERESFDIIINGIEVDKTGLHILSLEQQKGLKKNCLIIDAAANAGKAIEGTVFSNLNNPIYNREDVYYYVVSNAPSIFYKQASLKISESFSKNVYKRDINIFKELVE